LPVNDANFAVSYPDFIPIDVEASCTGRGVSDRDFKQKQEEVDKQVRSALDSIFGKDVLENHQTIHKFLRVGLASHLRHIIHIEEWLPANAKIRQTPLFTNPLVSALQEHVRIAMPWEDHYKYFKIQPTGLPAHVAVLYGMKKLEKKIDNIPKQIEGLLEERQMNGPVSLAEMRSLVTEAVSESVNCLTEKIEAALGSQRVAESNATNVSANTDAANDQPSRAPRFNLFDHPDRIRRRVPKDWEFPKLNLQHMYLLWHCGNESQNAAAIKL